MKPVSSIYDQNFIKLDQIVAEKSRLDITAFFEGARCALLASASKNHRNSALHKGRKYPS